MENTFINWLKQWRTNFAEVVIVAGTVGSAVTTWVGAYKLVSESVLVATMLALFFQGGLFTVAHVATDKTRPHHHPRRIALFLAWILLASFSVYASALGMFELVKPSLSGDNRRSDVVAQWQDGEKQIAAFKTNALGWITKAKEDANLKLAFERNRERIATTNRIAYRQNRKITLNSRLDSLNSAEAAAEAIKLLSGTPPAKIEDAVTALDDGFASANSAYAALPDDGKPLCPAPQRKQVADRPVETQKAFWAEAKSGSAPIRTMFLFAFLLDFLPALLRYASRPKLTFAEKIQRTRLSGRRLWQSLVEPLTPELTPIHVAVVGYPQLSIKLNLSNGSHALTLQDLRADLQLVGNEVASIVGRNVKLRSVMNTSQMEIVPDFPVLPQLDSDQTIHVEFEPQTVGVFA